MVSPCGRGGSQNQSLKRRTARPVAGEGSAGTRICLQPSSSETKKQSRHGRPSLKTIDAAKAANAKEENDENQADQHLRGRPRESPELLHRRVGVREEGRRFARGISLAHGGGDRRA